MSVQLKVALQMFGHVGALASLKAISRVLDVSVGSVNRYTKCVASALCAHMPIFIRWPNTNERKVIESHFRSKKFLKGTSAVGGKLLPILRGPSMERDCFALFCNWCNYRLQLQSCH